MIKLLIGGSPCTNWSIAQRKNRETTASGIGWELFLNYVIAKEKFKPDFFLYENNKSAAPAIKEQISIELGVPLMHIDSALVSAQTRKRFYAFNWTVPQPEDRGILLRDILEDGIPDRDKAHCLKHQVGNVRDYFQKNHTQVAFVPVGVGFRNRRDEDGTLSRRFETHGQPKANALTTVQTDSMVAEPLNVTEDGKAQCLRATYYKDGIRNLVGNTVDRRTCVAEPIRVGGMPRPSGEVSQSQGLRIYSADGKAVSLKANAGGAGGKTGLYAIPDGSGPIRVANIGKGRQGERIYDASGKSCAVKQQGGGPGGHAQGLYATPCEELEGEMLVKIEPPIYWVEGGKSKSRAGGIPSNCRTAPTSSGNSPSPNAAASRPCRTITAERCPTAGPTPPSEQAGQRRSSSTSCRAHLKMCRETRKSSSSPCMTVSPPAATASTRWASPMSDTMHTR